MNSKELKFSSFQGVCKGFSVGLLRISLVLIILVFWWCSPVSAHKVYVFAWAEGGVVHTESSFGDRRVNNGSIEVEDMAGTLVTKGVTDDGGNFSFKIPEDVSSDLVVNLDASMGHRAIWTVPLAEMQQAMGQGALSGDSSEDSKASLDLAMAQKEKLEKGPSAVKIVAGIGIIFTLAFAGAWVRGRINQRRINQGQGGKGQLRKGQGD